MRARIWRNSEANSPPLLRKNIPAHIRHPMGVHPLMPSHPPVASAPAVPPKRSTQQTVIPKNVSVSVLSGRLKGTVIPVSDQVTIGRDPNVCDVVFPADAIEVSRRHCSVSFNRQTGRVLLEDFSSANGTYFPQWKPDHSRKTLFSAKWRSFLSGTSG